MTKRNIEVEIRSFVSKKKYNELLRFFQKNGRFLGRDSQTTYYYRSPWDLRIQKSNFFSRIWLKKGKIHDTAREELEIRFDRNDFEKLKTLFDILGYKIDIKWLRTRHSFIWKGIDVAIDYTKGYGYIIELEKVTNLKNQEKTVDRLRKILKKLKISETPRKIFDDKFEYYRKNWKKLIK